MHTRSTAWVRSLAAAAGIATVAPRPAGADPQPTQITNGALDEDDRDLGVVGLEIGVLPYCSGTLIAPRVVLTAAHCVVDHAPARVFVGARPGVDGMTVAVVDVRVEPSFDPASLGGDVAVLRLDRAIDAAIWPVLPAKDAAALAGGALRLVGFGRTFADDAGPPRKRTGAAGVGGVAATSFELTPSPSQTCAGDSGGPAFLTIGGVEYLAGVTSSGDARCQVRAIDARPDAYQASLIGPALRAAEDDGGDAGGCAAARSDRARPPLALWLALAALARRGRR